MIREYSIAIYLTLFKLLFSMMNLLKLKNKIVFVSSFGDNVEFVANQIASRTDCKIIIVKGKKCSINPTTFPMVNFIPLESKNPFQFVRMIYHLATSKFVFVDNYFGFLAVTNFKKQVKCIQLWHAAGAIKRFGLENPSNVNRSTRAMKRFQQVYDRFDYVVSGSDKMATIFTKSFGMKNESRILKTGIPRTDFFFHQEKMDSIKGELRKRYPLIDKKKVILYAPTYRESDLTESRIALDLDMMYEHLREDYVILLKLHPAVLDKDKVKLPSFLINVSDYPNINHLLTITDILITDYSSIPMEFSYLEKPMIFYAYDLEEYEEERGFWEDYQKNIPGPIAFNTKEIIQLIKKDTFDLGKIKTYSEIWNQYSNGHSSENLLKALDITKV